MAVMFIRHPLELNTFPTILLVATMLRLALNLASTRLILANGHTGTDAAGHVIEAFGNFVVGGNYVIGLIVFEILVIVNFLEIGRAHVCTPVTNAHLVCSLLLETKKIHLNNT